MIDNDPFNSLNALRIPDEQLQRFQARAQEQAAAREPSRTEKRRRHFIKVPMHWAEQLQKARYIATYRVAHHLLYQNWKTGGQPIQLANGVLAQAGISRRQKWRALAELEHLGLIRIERRTRKSPLIAVAV